MDAWILRVRYGGIKNLPQHRAFDNLHEKQTLNRSLNGINGEILNPKLPKNPSLTAFKNPSLTFSLIPCTQSPIPHNTFKAHSLPNLWA